MKKILSLITAFVLCTSFVSAKTIYCKMEQSWWKVDNAAVGCHYWGTPGPGTSWPGVRMTPVEGETDLWSIELDTDKVQNVIFTRVNPSGAIADWGAKTKDLQIPTDDKNLFTITTSSASWGDPGCEGEWSVYGGAVEKPKHDYTITVYLPAFCDDIAAYADSVRVMGGFDDWSNGIYMQKIVDEDFNDCWVAEIKDVEEGTEFKLRFGTDADWKVQVQLNGANMANEAFGETTDIVLHYDGEGYGFAACAAPVARKEFVFVAGAAADSDPAMFAITWGKDGSSETVKMEKQEEALYAADILATVDSVVLVRCATGATEIIWGEGTNVWNQTANYALCDTMYFGEWTEEGLFTLTCEAPKPVETKYYAKNNWDGGEWSWKEMNATNKENIYMLDSVVFGGGENAGININSKADDADAKWFDIDHINVVLADGGGDGFWSRMGMDTVFPLPLRVAAEEEPQPLKLQAGDTIILVFNAADTTLQAGIYGRLAPVARKEFVFVAGEAADSDPAMFAITWGKDGSNETVKLANKADDIYTAEILETVDSLVLVRCASDAAEIIWGEGTNVWNQTANYALCDTMYFESWVEKTNLFAVTCEAPKPVETKYYAKNNWNGGEWSWKEMNATNKENIYMLDSVVFGGGENAGININSKADDADAKWFDVDHINVVLADGGGDGFWSRMGMDTVFPLPLRVAAEEEPQPLKLQAGDTIILVFNAADTTLQAGIYGRPAPVARKEFVFVAGEAADSDPALFAITWGKDGSSETVKMEKQEEALYAADILATVDSVVLVRCATGATEIIWGEGTNVWNQTANYALCDTMYFESWVEKTNLFAVTCEAPKPVETKYYAKNNWNGGEWLWKEMTKVEDLYVLDSVIFGGGETSGVNINSKADDADALWFKADSNLIVIDATGDYGTPQPPLPRGRDTIPYAPRRAGETNISLLAGDTILLAFNAADSTLTAYILGRPQPECEPGYAIMVNGERHMLSLNAEQQDYTEYWIDSLELKVDDEIVLFDTCAQVTFKVAVKGYEGFEPVGESDTLRVTEDAYYQFYLKLIYGADELYVVKLEEPVEPKFYVTGNAALVGEEKAWQADAIEMVDYTHTFPMLAAGEYQLKVTDGTWEHAWGYYNLSPTVAVEGLYTDVDGNICFTVYTPNDVTVTFAQGYVIMTGDFTNPQPADEGFGIILGDGTTIKGQKNEGQIEFLEYVTEANLTAGATFQLYDFANEAAWTVDNIDEASTPNLTINEDDVYEVTADGKYTIYLKMYGMGNDQVYCAYEGTGTGLDQLKAMPNQRFNILGLPVDANYRGVVIMNGKTYLQ